MMEAPTAAPGMTQEATADEAEVAEAAEVTEPPCAARPLSDLAFLVDPLQPCPKPHCQTVRRHSGQPGHLSAALLESAEQEASAELPPA